jgi:hypothetical protein
MRYFVVGANGELFGPADMPTLNQWIAEGRLLPTTMVQEELGGARFAASMLQGLSFPQQQSAAYPRMGNVAMPTYDNGAEEIKKAWIFGIVGFFCFGIILGPLGLYYAIKAKQKGNPQAVGAIVLCAIITGLSVLGFVFMLSGGLFSRF